MRHIAAAAIACAMLGACYANAQAARTHQTINAHGWFCYGEPIVSCPNRPGGVCSGWDAQWLATCPDSGTEWACHLDGSGRGQAVCGRIGISAASVRSAPARPVRRRAEVEEIRDEFTGRTTYRVIGVPLLPEARAPQGAELMALGAPGLDVIELLLTIPSAQWRYLECDSVHMLADGHQVTLGEAGRHRGDVLTQGVIEHVRVSLPWESVAQLAVASAVRVRVCHDVFNVDAAFPRHIAQIAERISPAVGASEAASAAAP